MPHARQGGLTILVQKNVFRLAYVAFDGKVGARAFQLDRFGDLPLRGFHGHIHVGERRLLGAADDRTADFEVFVTRIAHLARAPTGAAVMATCSSRTIGNRACFTHDSIKAAAWLPAARLT